MVKAINSFLFLCVFLLILIIINCTSNPLGDDEVSTRGQKITGKISLNDNASPENIYVWLAGVEVGTFTNAEGQFDLRLPSTAEQAGRGISGHFSLYFYVSNYRLDSVSVAIRKGVVQTGQADINDEGEVEIPVVLKKLCAVHVSATPSYYPYFAESMAIIQEYCHIFTGFEEPFLVLVELTSLTHSLVIKYPGTTTGPASIIFLKSIESKEPITKIIAVSETILSTSLVTQELAKESKSWIGSIQLTADILPPGKYEIIPYFFIEQNNVPKALLNSLYLSTNTPGLDFVNIPMKRSKVFLEIR